LPKVRSRFANLAARRIGVGGTASPGPRQSFDWRQGTLGISERFLIIQSFPKELVMADAVPINRNANLDAQSLNNFLEAQERGTALMTRANDILVKTAAEVWGREVELFKLETEQTMNAFMPPKLGEDGGNNIFAYYRTQQAGADKVIAQIRDINDIMRNCGWQIFGLCAESLKPQLKQA
jgi:hypothetical protein